MICFLMMTFLTQINWGLGGGGILMRTPIQIMSFLPRCSKGVCWRRQFKSSWYNVKTLEKRDANKHASANYSTRWSGTWDVSIRSSETLYCICIHGCILIASCIGEPMDWCQHQKLTFPILSGWIIYGCYSQIEPRIVIRHLWSVDNNYNLMAGHPQVQWVEVLTQFVLVILKPHWLVSSDSKSTSQARKRRAVNISMDSNSSMCSSLFCSLC